MRTRFYSLLVGLMISVLLIGGQCSKPGNHNNSSSLFLHYTKPAKLWVEALPVGNGRLAAMVFGGAPQERIQLNEGTVWAGGPYDNVNPEAYRALPQVQQLIFAGKYEQAHRLVNEKMIARQAHGMPYQTVGDLVLYFPGHDSCSHYQRRLNLDNATTTVSYRVGEVTYTREVFASFTDQVIIIRLSADKPDQITFTAEFASPQQTSVTVEAPDVLVMNGRGSDFEGVTGQITFQARAKIIPQRGVLFAENGRLRLEHGDNVTIMIAMATNFINYQNLGGAPDSITINQLANAAPKSYPQLLNAHSAAYRQYFDRVTLDLGSSPAVNLPTDERVKGFAAGNDPQLAALYFQFGRYLLISASQPGGQPVTLQGLWNEQMQPPWDSKYTVNINTAMNYWPGEPTNLPEPVAPLIQMVSELAQAGSETARRMYNAGGWVVHHNTDIWRMTAPIDGAAWGMWPSGGAWLCQHLWNHYLYNGDKQYLQTVYPVLKGAAQFFLDVLIEEPTHRWLVVSPSISPENPHVRDKGIAIDAGVTMDNQLVHDLFSNTIQAATILETDSEYVQQLVAARNRLAPMHIGQYGQLQEWLQDKDDPQDKHRHVSHLWGLHPGNLISPRRTPELFAAVRKSLEYRGDVSTGWSMAWKINLWARLLDGNHAYKMLTDQLSLVSGDRGFYQHGGTYPNLFDAHPPFQIDGNLGCTAGIAEMLLQSYDGDIFILPALPAAWLNGSVTGLRAPGGFEISFTWKEGKPRKIHIQSHLGGNCRIRVYDPLKSAAKTGLHSANGDNSNPFYQTPVTPAPVIADSSKIDLSIIKDTFVYDFMTQPGGEYILSAAD